MHYQQLVVTICLYQGRHSVAGIPLGFAGKAPQEGFQEEEVEHGDFGAALPLAPIKALAQGGTIMPGSTAAAPMFVAHRRLQRGQEENYVLAFDVSKASKLPSMGHWLSSCARWGSWRSL